MNDKASNWSERRSEELTGLKRELETLDEEDFQLIGERWRRMAVPVVGGTPDVNVLVAEAVRAANQIMSDRSALEQAAPRTVSVWPLPSDHEMGSAVAEAQRIRKRASEKTADDDAINAIAGLAQVVYLRPWVPEAFFDNAAAAFRAARPGFQDYQEGLEPGRLCRHADLL